MKPQSKPFSVEVKRRKHSATEKSIWSDTPQLTKLIDTAKAEAASAPIVAERKQTAVAQPRQPRILSNAAGD